MSSKAHRECGFFADSTYRLLARLKTSRLLVWSRRLSSEVGNYETNTFYTSQDVCEGNCVQTMWVWICLGKRTWEHANGGVPQSTMWAFKIRTHEGGHIALQHDVYRTMRKNTGIIVNQPLLWASGQTKDMAMPAREIVGMGHKGRWMGFGGCKQIDGLWGDAILARHKQWG